jgi:hypothetical protein
VVTRKPPPPLTANMDPVLLAKVIGTLFPRQDSDAGRSGSSLSSGGDETSSTTTAATTSTKRSEELRVTLEELLAATKGMASRDVAPGPDGIPGRVWAETMEVVAPRVRKEGRPPDSPSA